MLFDKIYPLKEIDFDKGLWVAADLLGGNVAANEYRDKLCKILKLFLLSLLDNVELTTQ